jgi:hypothetical protein
LSYSSNVLATSGLVSYWRLDEPSGTSAADSKGTNTGTYNGSPSLNQASLLVGDPADASVKFDGGGTQSVSIPTLSIFTSSFSIELWINATDLAANGIVFGVHGAQSTDQSIHLRLQTSGVMLFGYFADDLAGVRTLSAGTTYHVVATYNSGSDTSSLYINGTLDNSGAQGPFTGTSPVISIGRWFDVGTAQDYFKGTIDDVAIYNTDLSASTVLDHYTVGSSVPAPDTVNARDFGQHTIGPF